MDDTIKRIKEDIKTFIFSCPIGDKWPKRAVLLVNERVYHSDECEHAEMKALPFIREMLETKREVVMYINYSPCSKCAAAISEVLRDNPDVLVTVKFATVYQPKGQAHRDGLRKLTSEPNITIETIQGDGWMTLIQKVLENHGRKYWETRLDGILETNWESGLEKVLHEISRCHRVYWKAKSLQTVIHSWEEGLDALISKLFLDDKEEIWEAGLEKVLQENWRAGKECVLRKVLEHHGEDNWKTVVALIFKYQNKDGWKTVLRLLLGDPGKLNDELKTELEQLINNLGMDLSHAALAQSTELFAWLMSTDTYCHPNKNSLVDLSAKMSPNHRQGYVWLHVVLSALDITVQRAWIGQRIFADNSAATKFEGINENSANE